MAVDPPVGDPEGMRSAVTDFWLLRIPITMCCGGGLKQGPKGMRIDVTDFFAVEDLDHGQLWWWI